VCDALVALDFDEGDVGRRRIQRGTTAALGARGTATSLVKDIRQLVPVGVRGRRWPSTPSMGAGEMKGRIVIVPRA